MITEENSIGKPLANATWLEKHHNAKIPERTKFAQRLIELHPHKIVDLGCASGLWLALLNEIFPNECEFIGIDNDEQSLSIAKERSKLWNRNVSFLKLDIEKEVDQIPSADLILAFNIFPYIDNLDLFIKSIFCKNKQGTLAIRQYDGASIRFGPMPTNERQQIESDLRVALENNTNFRHYDMDRVYTAIHSAPYQNKTIEFELFERTSPFDSKFIPYYTGTLNWTAQFLSEASSIFFDKWMQEDPHFLNRYFYEVDLMALLS